MEKKTLPAVQCSYSETGKELSELLEESFRLYLRHALENPESESCVRQYPQ